MNKECSSSVGGTRAASAMTRGDFSDYRGTSGAAVVPMNVLLKGREVAYYLEDSGATVVFSWHAMAEEASKAAETVGIECISI